jgi:hypothetical protein
VNCIVSICSSLGASSVTISLAHCPIYAITGTMVIAILLDCGRCFVQIGPVFVGRCVKSSGLAFGIYCTAVTIKRVWGEHKDYTDMSVERVHSNRLNFQSGIFKRTFSHHVSGVYLVHHMTLYTRASLHVLLTAGSCVWVFDFLKYKKEMSVYRNYEYIYIYIYNDTFHVATCLDSQ